MRKNARIEDVPLEGTPGDVRIIGETAMISNGVLWLPYPEGARSLIEMAQDHGWGHDDGMPRTGRRCRLYGGTVPYIRVLIGRNPGINAVYGSPALGCRFHITWRMSSPESERERLTWLLGKMYVKTSLVTTESGQAMWQAVPSIKTIREMIAREPVRVPSHLMCVPSSVA